MPAKTQNRHARGHRTFPEFRRLIIAGHSEFVSLLSRRQHIIPVQRNVCQRNGFNNLRSVCRDSGFQPNLHRMLIKLQLPEQLRQIQEFLVFRLPPGRGTAGAGGIAGLIEISNDESQHSIDGPSLRRQQVQRFQTHRRQFSLIEILALIGRVHDGRF